MGEGGVGVGWVKGGVGVGWVKGGWVWLSFQNFCKKVASHFSHKKGGIGEIGGLFYCI